MTALCPTCHGDCCSNESGSLVDHGSVLALHSCPDCFDGFAPANALCSTCGGLCCRVSASLHTRVLHRSVAHTTHECDCFDGTVPAPDLAAERLTALLDAERENTALRAEVAMIQKEIAALHAVLLEIGSRNRSERAAVVAFVRGARLDDLAAAIERGEHRRGEGA